MCNVGPRLPLTDSLVMLLDAGNPLSYPGSGTAWNDLSGNGNNGTLLREVMGTTTPGTIVFDGSGERDGNPTGDYVTVSEAVTKSTNYVSGCTYFWAMRIAGAQPNGHAIFWGSGTIRHVEIRPGTPTYFRTEAALQNGFSFGASGVPDGFQFGELHTYAIVFNNDVSPRTVEWYKDGVLFFTDANFDNGTGGTSEYFSFSRIGRATGATSYLYVQSLKGDVPLMSIYGINMTKDEVLGAHNALKGRLHVAA